MYYMNKQALQFLRSSFKFLWLLLFLTKKRYFMYLMLDSCRIHFLRIHFIQAMVCTRLGQTFPQAYFTQFHTWDRKIIWNITATSHQRYYKQKQPPRGVPWDRCSKNMNLQENTHTDLRFQNHTLAWVFSCKFTAYFQNTFS